MLLRCLAVVALVAVSGCASKHELAKCKGPLIALNGDRWSPSEAEMTALAKLCPEEK
jgi:hypothetical protein